MPLEDVAHGLVTDGVAQVGEGPNDPVIAPGAILLGHTDHQVLDSLSTRGRPTDLRTFEVSTGWSAH